MSRCLENMKTPKYDIPLWHKLNLTIEEAAAYSGIGVRKLYDMTGSEECPFVLWILQYYRHGYQRYLCSPR